MTSRRFVFAALVAGTLVGAQTATAQPLAPRHRIGVEAGVNRLPIGGTYGDPSITAFALALAISQPLSAGWAADLRARALFPTQQYEAIPMCTPGSSCLSSASPGRLVLLSAHVGRSVGRDQFHASIGGGTLSATGARPGPTNSAFADLGLDWRPLLRRAVTPTLGLHGMFLQRRVSGMKTLVLPSIGFVF